MLFLVEHIIIHRNPSYTFGMVIICSLYALQMSFLYMYIYIDIDISEYIYIYLCIYIYIYIIIYLHTTHEQYSKPLLVDDYGSLYYPMHWVV